MNDIIEIAAFTHEVESLAYDEATQSLFVIHGPNISTLRRVTRGKSLSFPSYSLR